MRALWLAILVAACGSDDKAEVPPKELAACEQGDARSCFVAAQHFHRLDGDKKLDRAIEYWKRGCELGHGASCGQLGTVLEFGLSGREVNRAVAMSFYRRGCDGGDAMSCKALGVPSPDAPAEKQKFPWGKALAEVCGKRPAELGPLFDGLVLGEPMPAAVQARIAQFEKTYKAKIHYYPGDRLLQSFPTLDVKIEEPEGLFPILVRGWGKPTLDWGAWANDELHLMASLTRNEKQSGLFWTQYRSVAELIRPDDPDRLGLEPIPAVGAKLSDLEAALGDRLLRRSEHGYIWNEIGVGPHVEVQITERAGVVVQLRVNIITNSSSVGDAFLAALAKKYGPPKLTGTKHSWRHRGRRISAWKPVSGNLELVVEK